MVAGRYSEIRESGLDRMNKRHWVAKMACKSIYTPLPLQPIPSCFSSTQINIEPSPKGSPMQIQLFIDEYLVSRSRETEKAYRSDLTKFEEFLLEEGLEISAVRPVHIRKFAPWLSVRRNTRTKHSGLSEDTVKRHISAVRACSSWLRFSDPQLLDATSFFRFRSGRIWPKVLGIPADVVDRMFGADEKKEAAIVLLFRRSGVRLSELVALNKLVRVLPRNCPGARACAPRGPWKRRQDTGCVGFPRRARCRIGPS